MITLTVDGKKFAVVFDYDDTPFTVPGIKREHHISSTTLCRVFELDPERERISYDQLVQQQPVTEAKAMCSAEDIFDKAEGRRISWMRATAYDQLDPSIAKPLRRAYTAHRKSLRVKGRKAPTPF